MVGCWWVGLSVGLVVVVKQLKGRTSIAGQRKRSIKCVHFSHKHTNVWFYSHFVRGNRLSADLTRSNKINIVRSFAFDGLHKTNQNIAKCGFSENGLFLSGILVLSFSHHFNSNRFSFFCSQYSVFTRFNFSIPPRFSSRFVYSDICVWGFFVSSIQICDIFPYRHKNKSFEKSFCKIGYAQNESIQFDFMIKKLERLGGERKKIHFTLFTFPPAHTHHNQLKCMIGSANVHSWWLKWSNLRAFPISIAQTMRRRMWDDATCNWFPLHRDSSTFLNLGKYWGVSLKCIRQCQECATPLRTWFICITHIHSLHSLLHIYRLFRFCHRFEFFSRPFDSCEFCCRFTGVLDPGSVYICIQTHIHHPKIILTTTVNEWANILPTPVIH